MLHHISLCSIGSSVRDSSLQASIVFFNTKSDNKLFNSHLLHFVHQIALEIFPGREELLHN